MSSAVGNKPVKPANSSGTQDNVYAGVYRVLLGGMLLSSTLFAVAMVLALLHPRSYPLSSQWVLEQYRWSTLLHGLARGEPFSLMLIASILLILTPILRVAVSIYAFAVDGDRKYVVVTSIVLAVIVLTVLLSKFAGLK